MMLGCNHSTKAAEEDGIVQSHSLIHSYISNLRLTLTEQDLGLLQNKGA